MITRYIINNSNTPDLAIIILIFGVGFGLIYAADFVYKKINRKKKADSDKDRH